MVLADKKRTPSVFYLNFIKRKIIKIIALILISISTLYFFDFAVLQYFIIKSKIYKNAAENMHIKNNSVSILNKGFGWEISNINNINNNKKASADKKILVFNILLIDGKLLYS